MKSVRRAALTGVSVLTLTAGLLSALGTAGVSAAARQPASSAASRPALITHRTAQARRRVAPSEVTGLVGWGSAANKTMTNRIYAARKALGASGIELTQWGPDAATGKVKIYLTHYSARARRALIRRFGPDVIVARHSLPRMAPAGRTDDLAPFSGGDWIFVGSSGCTSGPTVIGNSTGSTFMLTAGHCGAVGASVQTVAGDPMGQVFTRRLCDGCIDSEMVTGNYSPTVWGGGSSDDVPLWQEDGLLFPMPGQGPASLVTSDGRVTGEIRGITVTAVNQNVTLTDGITRRFITLASKAGAEPCKEGDSGGPWFQHEGNTAAVKIVGTAVGAPVTQTPGETCSYQQIDSITTFFNVHVPS